MVDDWVIKTMYATKRRRRNAKSSKPPPGKETIKSNPSKRHRERLNSELDHLASLLPFEQNVISKLDKLSILRLAVSYLRIKCYFQTFFHDRMILENRISSHLYHYPFDPSYAEGDACLQALNGFVFIVSCDGEVFFASRTVEYYLGFHQSDIIHQSVLELIHSEDREEFKRQLSWSSLLPSDKRDLTLQDAISPENCHYMQRCFTVRFRCLLDNTSGFITLEISGRLQFLHGQSRKVDDSLSSLGLFAVCSPFGPLPSLDAAQRDLTFKTKHNMDLSIISMDVRAKMIFAYSEKDLSSLKCYELLHPDDLSYTAKGHSELLKNGSIGLLVHRWLNKSYKWIWLQTSLKVVYKNGKQDCIIATHRQLTEDEGRDLFNRRNSEYKLPFPLLEPETLMGEEDDEILKNGKTSSGGGIKRPKSQLKDYLQASRKRKAPYREIINGYNGYNGYPGFPALSSLTPGSATAADFMYPYNGAAAAAFSGLEAAAAVDMYRNGHSAYSTGSMDSHSAAAAAAAGGASYYGYDPYGQSSLPPAYQNAAAVASCGYSNYSGFSGLGVDLLKSRLEVSADSTGLGSGQSSGRYSTGPVVGSGSVGATGLHASSTHPYTSGTSLYSRCYNPYGSGGHYGSSGGGMGSSGANSGGSTGSKIGSESSLYSSASFYGYDNSTALTGGHHHSTSYSPTRNINQLKSKSNGTDGYSCFSEPAIQVPVVKSSVWHSPVQPSSDHTAGLVLGYRESLMNAG